MPRKTHIISSEHSYHIYARCNNREHYPIDLYDVWRIYENYLWTIGRAFTVNIQAFVLMPNHFHMIAMFPEANMSRAMLYFMRETSKEISLNSNLMNHLYGSAYRKTFIGSYHHFLHAYKYVYRNPVEAGLSTLAEEYPYSTLQGLIGLKRLVIPAHDVILTDSTEKTLEWINQDYTTGVKTLVQNALRKDTFKFPLARNGRQNELDTYLS